MKTCSKCKQSKPFTEFHKDKRTADGHRSQCKICFNETTRKWAKKNPEKRAAHDRKYRQENREKRAAYFRKWRQGNLEKVTALKRRYPEKYRARQALHQAVASGKLVKPEACEHCNTPTEKHRLHGHHHDYSRPLDVVWLCAKCHGIEHRKYPEIDGDLCYT